MLNNLLNQVIQMLRPEVKTGRAVIAGIVGEINLLRSKLEAAIAENEHLKSAQTELIAAAHAEIADLESHNESARFVLKQLGFN